MNEELMKFKKENSKFLKIKDGETFEGFYLGFQITKSSFNPDENTIQWKLKYLDCENPIYWTNGSMSVVDQMQDFNEGDVITISRKGSGTHDTKYSIEKKS